MSLADPVILANIARFGLRRCLRLKGLTFNLPSHIIQHPYISIMAHNTPTKRTTRSSKGNAATADSALQPTTDRTAARRVYDTPELRQLIIGYITRHDLTSFARVEMKCLHDVASVLYRRVSHSQVGTTRSVIVSSASTCSYLGVAKRAGSATYLL